MHLKAFFPFRNALALSLLALGLVSCHRNQTRPTTAEITHLTLLHTNDIHASISARELDGDAEGLIGGFIALDAEVDHIREAVGAHQTLLLDGGDLLTGGPASEIAWNGVTAGGLFELMNTVGYDAWTLGNHEFDGERAQLGLGVASLQFPTVEANLHLTGGGPLFPQLTDSRIIERAGLKIGLVGLMTEDMGGVLPPSKMEGLALTTAAEAASREVAKLDDVADLIIFITHMGLDADIALARAVPSIDVIVGGHSHTAVDPAVVEGRTLIVQAGSHLKHLGRLELSIQSGEVVDHSSELIPLTRPEAEASPEVVELVRFLEAEGEARYGRVIATLTEAWAPQFRDESNVGNWLCDQLAASTGSDFAVLNSGGIRTTLPVGEMTQGDLRSVLPFDNRVATFEVSGAELKAILLNNAIAQHDETHGLLQVGGLRYGWALGDNGQVVLTEITVGGEPLDEGKRYTGATVDYVLYAHPEKYLGLVPEARTPTDLLLYQAMAEAAERVGTITATLDGRIGRGDQ